MHLNEAAICSIHFIELNSNVSCELYYKVFVCGCPTESKDTHHVRQQK